MIVNNIITEKSEYVLSLGVVLTSLFLVGFAAYKSNFNYFCAGLFLLLSTLVYFKIRSHTITQNDTPAFSKNIENVNDIFLIILYLIGIIALYCHPVLYERPPVFFIVYFCMLSLVIIQILIGSKNHIKVLVYIIFLVSFYILSQALLFNTLMSIDSFEHMFFTNIIVDTGALPQISMSGYSYLFHILHAQVEIISGLDYNYSNLLAVLPAMMICTILTIFLIGKKLVTPQVGLLASFILICSTSFLFFSINLVPNSYSSIFFIMALLLLVIGNRADNNLLNKILLVFFIILITVTHALFNIAIVIVLIVYLLFFRQKSADASKIQNLDFLLITFSVIIMLVWWIYYLHFFSQSVDFLLSGLDYSEYRMRLMNDPFKEITSINLPFIESFHLNMSNFIFWIFGIPGCLYLIKKGDSNNTGYAFSFVGLTLIGLLSILIITGRSIINSRYFYLYSFIFCIFTAIFIILIFQSTRKVHMKIAIAIIILSLCIMCTIHPLANITNPIYGRPVGPQIYPFESELSMVSLLRSFNTKPLASDNTFAYCERMSGRSDITDITKNLKFLDFNNARDYSIVLSDSIFKVGYSKEITYPDQEIIQFSLGNGKFSKCFDVGRAGTYIF